RAFQPDPACADDPDHARLADQRPFDEHYRGRRDDGRALRCGARAGAVSARAAGGRGAVQAGATHAVADHSRGRSGRNHQSAAVPLCLTLYSQIDASFRMVDVDQLRVQLAKLDDQLVQWSLADDSIFERERQAGTPADEIMKMILNDRRERVIAGVPDPND